MKTKKNQKKINQRLIINSELLSFKMHRANIKNDSNGCSLLTTSIFSFFKQISFNFKKMMQIIFQYHLNRKKILVIGEKPLFKKQAFQVYKKTKHTFISETAWVNGLLSNTKTIKKFLKKKDSIYRLIKKPHLIILYDYWDLIDSESYNRRITSVALTGALKPKHSYHKSPAYFVAGKLTEIRKKKIHFFLSTLIEKIIKLPKLTRKHFRISFLHKKKYKKKYKKKIHMRKKIKQHRIKKSIDL